jgi:hypothetical protein
LVSHQIGGLMSSLFLRPQIFPLNLGIYSWDLFCFEDKTYTMFFEPHSCLENV